MTQIIKESSDFLEMKAISTNKEISEIKDKICSAQKQLDATRTEKYNIDLQLEDAEKKINSIKKVWIISIIIISISSIFSYSVSSLIPIIPVLVVLPIAVYFSRDLFNDLEFYNGQKRICAEKVNKIEDCDKAVKQYNERLKHLNNKYSDYTKGLIGERKVTEILNNLGNDNYLINDVTLDKTFGNIDHILVSKYGIFIIETKNWDGEFVCVGDRWNKRYENESDFFDLNIDSISRRVKGNARNLRLLVETKIFHNLMDVWVEGIIVFTNTDAKLKIINPTIPVLTIEELNEYIKRRPLTKFSSRDLESIANLILRETKDKYDQK